jgi:prepilin-type N-terminal cleavage/methylation domain-containing protein
MIHSLRRKAFTLLELIVVVVVLGILAALAIPSFSTVKQSAAEKVAYQSAEGIVRNAEALAAFDGAALNNTYLDTAGADTAGYNGSANTVTITSGGKTAVATIDASTGAITVGSGNGGNTPAPFEPTYSFSTASGDLGTGSCFYYNATFAGHTSNDIGFSCTSTAFQTAVATLSAGDQVRITMVGGEPVMYTVASTDLTVFWPLWINFTSEVLNPSYSGMTIEF